MLLQSATMCLKLWQIKQSTSLIMGENELLFLLWMSAFFPYSFLWENGFLWKVTFFSCWFCCLIDSLPSFLEFSLLSLRLLAHAYELDSPFIVSWKSMPNLMEGDLWLLRRLSNILVLSWNLNCFSYFANFLLMILPLFIVSHNHFLFLLFDFFFLPQLSLLLPTGFLTW